MKLIFTNRLNAVAAWDAIERAQIKIEGPRQVHLYQAASWPECGVIEASNTSHPHVTQTLVLPRPPAP